MDKQNIVRTGLLVASVALLGALFGVVTVRADQACQEAAINLRMYGPAGLDLAWDESPAEERLDSEEFRSRVCLTCVCVVDIQLRGLQNGENALVLDGVTVYNAQGPVQGARVIARWAFPDGNGKWTFGLSNTQGWARVGRYGTLRESYQLCAWNVPKEGLVYTPDQNVETCETFPSGVKN